MKPGVIAALVFAAIVAAVVVWRVREAEPKIPVAGQPAPASAPAPTAPPPVAEAASIPSPPPLAPSEAIGAEGVSAAIESVVGKRGLADFRTDDFAHRVVATVDNLARERASPTLWPVAPTPGRFTVRTNGGETVIDPDNGQRYAPFVQMLERVDLHRAVAVYRRMLPLLQPAYEALGYPKRSFNDRLVRVIDHLLAAPEPPGPVKVHLPPPAAGALPPARPWLLYEFDDPSLEELTAGQKLMVRMGLVDEQRVKKRLRELRAELVAG